MRADSKKVYKSSQAIKDVLSQGWDYEISSATLITSLLEYSLFATLGLFPLSWINKLQGIYKLLDSSQAMTVRSDFFFKFSTYKCFWLKLNNKYRLDLIQTEGSSSLLPIHSKSIEPASSLYLVIANRPPSRSRVCCQHRRGGAPNEVRRGFVLSKPFHMSSKPGRECV